MTRLTKLASYFALAFTLYIGLALHIVPIPFVSSETVDELVPYLPWNALIALGAWCLFELGWGIFTFGECPEAYEELMREISEAKDDLRAKGVSVD